MKPIDSKAIVKKLKAEKEDAKKSNVTFRLSKSVYAQFKATCEKQGLSGSAIVEEMMRQFIN